MTRALDDRKEAQGHVTAAAEAVEQGDYRTAVAQADLAMAFVGSGSVDDAALLDDVVKSADRDYQQGYYYSAGVLWKRVLTIAGRVFGGHHPNTLIMLNNLAVTYQAQGRYEEALPLQQRALAILEKALGQDHPDVATCRRNLAATYRASGRED